MNRPVSQFLTPVWLLLTLVSPAAAQPFESVGARALGMGGAFVAVANDSAATWWNPAGLATGPFLDVAISGGSGTADGRLPASRTGVWSFSLATLPLGVSYYRLDITDIRTASPTAEPDADREDGVSIRSLSVSQFGATVLHTITTGLNAGATVKYLRGTARAREIDDLDPSVPFSELLDQGDDLESGEGRGTVDIDLGVLATFGGLRVGVTGRNLREPRFADRRLSRQVRVGAAFDGVAAEMAPVMVSMDVDVRRYAGATGDRRVVALGAEHWLRPQRIALRGGARFNTVGEQDRTVTAGASVAARAGLFVEGHAAYGSHTGESGWGVAARVSF